MTERINQFTRDGLVFDVIDSGPRAATEAPVVALHGFPERASSWNGVTRILNDAGVRTLAPDQRGYSPGARPAKVRDYRLSELVGDVLALINTLDVPQVHLLSHDWGSAVAWSIAAQHPDRIASLTALAVPHTGAFLRAMPRGQLLKSWYMAAFQIPALPERVITKGSTILAARGRQSWLPAGSLDDLTTGIIEYGALPGGLNWYRALRFADPAAGRRKVSVPTTYIWGERDAFLSRAGARGCSEMVTGPYEFIALSGADHWLPQRHPDAIAEATLRRIASVTAGSTGLAT
ncbi:MAG: alpha/beta fold hydrolase [Gordonia sp. (in: high G+C Gram-positive bacteria)]